MTKVIIRYPLSDLRKTHDLNQRQLAELCGTTPDRISTWEAKKQKPRVELQAKLAKVFGMSLAELQSFCDWPETPDLMLRQEA